MGERGSETDDMTFTFYPHSLYPTNRAANMYLLVYRICIAETIGYKTNLGNISKLIFRQTFRHKKFLFLNLFYLLE